ncbi:DMT family transporter [Martelella endophytica]|uniref:EamA domain-containing protein n=1 Tax=Martelella endophytica TaxID=1486262 RepID=A0A0D5LSD4_MAREN|nr:DMT family transporter [Martelella endophytica]AJY46991.1 hypothetical protein TM49_16965 [Martelella endophytica]
MLAFFKAQLHTGTRLQGTASIVLAVFLLSLSDALVKDAGARFGLAQIILLRSLVATVMIAATLVVIGGPAALRLRCSLWVWARSLSLAAMWLCYYAALPSTPFALAAVCYYTSPIWMALMTRILGTHTGKKGWTAVTLSMAGAFLAVGPRMGALPVTLFLPLAAAAFYALAGVITWNRCQKETAGALALNLNLCLGLLASGGILALAIMHPSENQGFVFAIWPDLRGADWGLAIILGCLLAVITTLVARAYRLAPTPLIGVFDTAYLGFAAFWSVVFFDAVPTTPEGIGIALIALGAIMMSFQRGRP